MLEGIDEIFTAYDEEILELYVIHQDKAKKRLRPPMLIHSLPWGETTFPQCIM